MRRIAGGLFNAQRRQLPKVATYHETILVGGMAMQSAALEFLNQFPNKAANLTVCSQGSWTQKVTGESLNLAWGQPAHYLPLVTYHSYLTLKDANMFNKYNSKTRALEPFDYDPEMPMTLGMMGQIIDHQMQVLREKGVRLIVDEVVNISENAGYLSIQTREPSTQVNEHLIKTDDNYIVYNAAHSPRVPAEVQPYFTPRPSDAIYQLTQAPRVVGMFGCGKNVMWTLRDFKNVEKVVLFVPEGDTGLQTEYEDPKNHDRIQRVSLKHMAFTDLGEDILCEGYDIDKKCMLEIRLPKQHCYCAFGSQLNMEITKSLDPAHVKLIRNTPRPEKMPLGSSGALAAGKTTRHHTISGEEKSASFDIRDTKVPYGSFIQNYQRICEKMGTMSHLDPQSVINFHAWQTIIMDRMFALNLINSPGCPTTGHVIEHFFEKLSTLLIHVYRDQVPTTDIVDRIVNIIANQTFKGADLEKFKMTAQQFRELVLERNFPPKLAP